MKRKDFLNSACLVGVCSCVGMPFISNSKLFAGTIDNPKKEDDWRIGFMQKRFAKLLEVITKETGDEKRNEIIIGLGRECAKEQQNFYLKYKDNLDGFFDELKDSVQYDKNEKTIKIVGKKTGTCFCPFVDKSLISKDFCKCSLGYQKEIYESLLGKSVEVSIVESVLYGGEKCSFVIKEV